MKGKGQNVGGRPERRNYKHELLQMESLEKDHSYSEHPQQSEAPTEEHDVEETVATTRRLRDRELLRKRKAEAEEKDTHQWGLGGKSKRTRKGRGTGRSRGPRQTPESQTEPQPGRAEEKHEPTVAPLEEKVETSLDPQVESSLDPQVEFSVHPQVESSAPLVETEELHTPKEVAESPPTEPTICPVELEQTPRSEEPEMLASVENDHLEQELYPSF
ncbi:hemogen isoform X2 [Sphaerodactylus townsendi]|uniref:hemogen isoform X2 n=1 Tax=Sphaerodactylus townsendi TaxID=933632 RepID=UPI002026A00E|nr:hemogen isoform X2 [Sphaerodactylus townsendi]